MIGGGDDEAYIAAVHAMEIGQHPIVGFNGAESLARPENNPCRPVPRRRRPMHQRDLERALVDPGQVVIRRHIRAPLLRQHGLHSGRFLKSANYPHGQR